LLIKERNWGKEIKVVEEKGLLWEKNNKKNRVRREARSMWKKGRTKKSP